MSNLYGADVEQLRQLSRELAQQAEQLGSAASRVSGRVENMAWRGPDAEGFRSDWKGPHAATIRAVQQQLRDASAQALSNAKAQEEASGVSASASTATSTNEIEKIWERVSGFTANTLNAIDLGRLLASAGLTPAEANKLVDVFPELGKVLGPVGLALGASSIGTDFANGEYLKGALDLIPEGTGAALWAGDMLGWSGAATLGPLGLGVAAFAGFVDVTIPVTSQQQDDAYAMGVREEFGRGVDPNNLTSEQASAMSQRYAPPLGVAMMISDQMDSTADKIFPWNWGKK